MHAPEPPYCNIYGVCLIAGSYSKNKIPLCAKLNAHRHTSHLNGALSRLSSSLGPSRLAGSLEPTLEAGLQKSGLLTSGLTFGSLKPGTGTGTGTGTGVTSKERGQPS